MPRKSDKKTIPKPKVVAVLGQSGVGKSAAEVRKGGVAGTALRRTIGGQKTNKTARRPPYPVASRAFQTSTVIRAFWPFPTRAGRHRAVGASPVEAHEPG